MDCMDEDDGSIQLQLLEKFPMVLPQNNQFSKYEGYINIADRQWHLIINVPNYPSAKGIKLIPDWELEDVLADNMTAVLKNNCLLMMNTCKTGQRIHVTNACAQLRSLGSDALILAHVQSLGFNHVSALKADLRSVSLLASDSCGNTHEMSLKISSCYPDSIGSEPVLTVINTDLPKVVCELIQKECNIPSAYNCFSQQLRNLSSVWNELQLLDSKVWVIDPTHPKKCDMYRRIFIDSPKVMAQITWNPFQPLAKPDIMFQGAEAEVETFRNTYELHMEEWSSSCDILVNMCKVLNLTQLPEKQSMSDEVNMMQETGECCICMSAELNGTLPSVSCGQCLSCFHALCLFQWLEMLGKNRVVHNHISGDCPNCEAEIKCPDPNSTDLP